MSEERIIVDLWFPPPAERFVEYDFRDQEWMQPLGLGVIRKMDITHIVKRAHERMEEIILNGVYGTGVTTSNFGGQKP